MSNILDVLAIAFYSISAVYFSFKFFLKKERTRTLATLFLFLGFATHALDLIVYGLEHRHFPATNFAEAISLLSCAIVFIFILISRNQAMDAAAILLLPFAVGSILYVGLSDTGQSDLNPILKGEWIYIHIPLMIISVAALAISFLLAIMYLLQEKQLKSKHPAFFFDRLPPLEACEDLAFRSLWFGFFSLTFGILTGMIWSKYLRGIYWSWDVKEIWSIITWGLYAVLIHGRMLAAWRGRKAAYLAILGFVSILFAFAGVSALSKGYHSF